MARLPVVALVLFGLAAASGGGLAGCATFDEVEGVPNALEWSYFQGSPEEVVEAARRVLTLDGYTVEGIADEGGATVLTVTSRPPGAGFTQLRIERAAVRDYRARAQTGPPGRRLPRDLEVRISAEL